MQAPSAGGGPGRGSSLSTLYGGLSDFSSILTTALGTIDSNVSTLQSSSSNNQEQIDALRAQVERYGIKLQTLEAEAEEQRAKVEMAMLNVTDLGKNIDVQLTETTKQMHRELLTQRTSTKMDLFTLSGNIRKSMNEAMDLISESPKLLKSTASAVHNPNSSNEESIQFLLEKIKVIEDALMLQHNVNLQLSESVKNDEVVRKVYDSLYDQITHQEASLQHENLHNQELRDRSHRDIDKMRETQAAQQEQISQLVSALMSNKSMKKFKQNVHRNAENDADDAPHPDAEAGASQEGVAAEEEKDGAGSGEEDEGPEPAPRKRDRSRRRHRRHHRHRGDSDSDGSGEEDNDGAEAEGGDTFDERGERRHGTVKTRHHHHHHHHRTTVKETVVVKETVAAPAVAASAPAAASADTPTAAPAAAASMEDFSRTESKSGKRGAGGEIRKSKTFNSASRSEKETQTVKAAAASVSTNTDKPKTPPAPVPAPVSPTPPLPKQPDGTIIFDDESVVAAPEQKEEVVERRPRRQDSQDSLDESFSYYDSDSYYSVSIRGGVTTEQLERVAADARQQVSNAML
jgi:hypothetical protein